MRRRFAVVAIACVGCSGASSDEVVTLPPPSASPTHASARTATARPPGTTRAFDVTYETYGLMPFPRCGTETYRISVDRDGSVKCGWAYACPPYDAQPIEPKPMGTLAAHQMDRLAVAAQGDAFQSLPKFDADPHIIDGGMRRMVVHVDGAEKIVELANIDHPAFHDMLDLLKRETGCSMATAGQRPR